MLHGKFFAEAKLSPKVIQEFFYNSVVEKVLDGNGYSRDDLPLKIHLAIQNIIKSILENSEHSVGLKLHAGLEITKNNCPDDYEPFYKTLMSFKQTKVSRRQLDLIAQQVMQLDAFKATNPALFLLEAAGLSQTVQLSVHYDEHGVNADLIRTTFYNEMVNQRILALKGKVISQKDLDEQDVNIYTALPSLTLIEALHQSRHCAGIRLLDNKMLTEKNAPADYLAFTKIMLQLKPEIVNLSENELRFIRFKLAGDGKIPEDLVQYENSKLMETFGKLKGIAIEISRQALFQEIFGNVVTFCAKQPGMK